MKTPKASPKALLAVAAIVAISVDAFAASTLTLKYDNDPLTGYSSGVGGEFKAVVTSGSTLGGLNNPTALGYIANKTSFDGGFQTFCIEYHENFTPVNWSGPAYNYGISTGAISGGPGSHPTFPGTQDTLSIGTAWLYRQFATGILAGYDYALGSPREGSANSLQNAIWWLENESDYVPNPVVLTAQSTVFLNLAKTATGVASLSDLRFDQATSGAHYYGVSALNLGSVLSDPQYQNQDQLVLAQGYQPGGGSVPDGGATIVMLGSSIIALGLLRGRVIRTT